MRQPVSWRLPNYSTRVSQTTMLCLNQLRRSSDLLWQLLQCAHVTIHSHIMSNYIQPVFSLSRWFRFLFQSVVFFISKNVEPNIKLQDEEKKSFKVWYYSYMTLSSPLSTYCSNNAKNICSVYLNHISRKVKRNCFEVCI